MGSQNFFTLFDVTLGYAIVSVSFIIFRSCLNCHTSEFDEIFISYDGLSCGPNQFQHQGPDIH